MLARTIASLTGCLTLASYASAQQEWLLEVDPIASGLSIELESSLGPVTLVGSDECPVQGTLLVELTGGVLPALAFHGGDVDCAPSALGIVPNVLRSLPPLLEIDVGMLRLEPSSPTVPLSADGDFHLASEVVGVTGDLVVRVLGQLPLTVPLTGDTLVQARTTGTVTLDQEGLRVTRSIGVTVHLDVPALDLWVALHLRGAIVADLAFEGPEAHCPASPNSTGVGAVIELDGSASVSLDDCALIVSGAPPHSLGLYFCGSVQAEVTFGNGLLCTGGSVLRLSARRADASGTSSLPLDLAAGPHTQQLVPGSRWSFQQLYRDPAGGGARFNTTNGLNVLVYP